jgi:hypothetical protein
MDCLDVASRDQRSAAQDAIAYVPLVVRVNTYQPSEASR